MSKREIALLIELNDLKNGLKVIYQTIAPAEGVVELSDECKLKVAYIICKELKADEFKFGK